MVCGSVLMVGVVDDPYLVAYVLVVCALEVLIRGDAHREHKCWFFPSMDTDHSSYCSSLSCSPHNQLEKEGRRTLQLGV